MAKLDTEARDKLPTGVFGIPETRSYPLNDKNHVMAAIKMFRHAPADKKPQLVRNIRRRAKELGINVNIGDDTNMHKYTKSEKLAHLLESKYFTNFNY